VVATPPAWLFTQRWLDGFAYHTEPGVGIFALTALLAVVIVAGTVAGQTWRAARTHPASILRSNH
jgi:putative ABC transport system permease protein